MNVEELDAVMKSMGYELTTEELEKMIVKYDLDLDGKIDFYEFCLMMGWKTEDEAKAEQDEFNSQVIVGSGNSG